MYCSQVNEPVATVCVKKLSNTFATVESKPAEIVGTAFHGRMLPPGPGPTVCAVTAIVAGVIRIPVPHKVAAVVAPIERIESMMRTYHGMLVCATMFKGIAPESNTTPAAPKRTSKRKVPGVVTAQETIPVASMVSTSPTLNVFAGMVKRFCPAKGEPATNMEAAAAVVSVGPAACSVKRLWVQLLLDMENPQLRYTFMAFAAKDGVIRFDTIKGVCTNTTPEPTLEVFTGFALPVVVESVTEMPPTVPT